MSEADSAGPGPGAGPEPEVPWLQLHGGTLAVTALQVAGAAFLVAVPMQTVLATEASWPIAMIWLLIIAVLALVATTGADLVRIWVTHYRVTEARVEMRTGLLVKRRRSLARERIRSVDLSANPLHRVFKLAKVKVGTGESGAGPGGQTLTLNAVSRAEAERLRTELLRHAETKDADSDTEQRLATWRPGWLKYAPLSFLTPLLSFAVVGATFQVADWFGRGGLPVEITADLVERHGPWRVLGMGFAAVLLIGVIGSLVFQGEAWWGHRLDREPGGTLRVRRGLLVNRSLSLEEERIRGVEIVEPLGVRLARASRLDVVAIGLQTDAKHADLSTLVPAAPRSVTVEAAEAVIGPVETMLIGHPKAARRRRLRWAAMAIAALAAVVAAIHLLWSVPGFWSTVIVIGAALLGAWAVWTAFDAYASLGHGLARGYMVARRGSVRRSTVRLDRSGIIGWRIRQSVFQRRMGLMTVEATTAAGRGHYAAVDGDRHEILDFADAAVPELLRPFLIRTETEEGSGRDDS